MSRGRRVSIRGISWSKKRGNSFHPILDLHALNMYFRRYKLRMLRQDITFLGLTVNFLTYTVHLSAERVEAFRSTLACFVISKQVNFSLCFRLLRLMASVLLLVRLDRLYMRNGIS